MKKSAINIASVFFVIPPFRLPYFLILWASFLVFFSSCQENDITKVKAMFNEKDVDVEVADSVKFIYKEGAYTRAIVTGKTVKRYTNTQNKLVFPGGLLVKFYEQLNLISILKANYAENDDAQQTINVSGNVYMENARNEIIETAQLTWNIRTKKIYTDKSIKIRTPDNIIYGTGFDSDEDFSNYTIRKVNGIVAVDDSEGFK
ncbi:MAG TPA: LPS export ABC transporter periplasmic protein LptC [Chitinophagales bacterium]|nr:LPS export ABC transporter periplasmic protein LptC [Chitinophagales bacterium]HNM31299.1 LPS export ABC transporter periplasmic protein LptC [Chitinophagales bacterium]